MKYIDSEKLIAEIERMREINRKAIIAEHIKADIFHGRAQAINHLFEFITSLQQEQPGVDLEKAYKSYMESRKDDLSGNAVTINMKDLARHFYTLGLNLRKK